MSAATDIVAPIEKRRKGSIPEYGIWRGMKLRCNSTSSKHYARYGGRGIKICERWKDFFAFYEDVGSRPTPKHSLDRIDNNGNYEPGNVRWATQEQQTNNRRDNRHFTWKGESLSSRQWSRRVGLTHGSIYVRIVVMGWDVERALTTPLRGYKPKEPRS